jgi:hypothetical protein
MSWAQPVYRNWPRVRWRGNRKNGKCHADAGVQMQVRQEYPVDQSLLALNSADQDHQRSFIQKLLPMAADKQLGMIGMKIPVRGTILVDWKPTPSNTGGWEGPATGQGRWTANRRCNSRSRIR